MSKERISARIEPALNEQINRIAAETGEDVSRVVEDLLNKGLRYDMPHPTLSLNLQDKIAAEAIRAFEIQSGICIREFLNTPRKGSVSLLAALSFIAIVLVAYLAISVHL